MTASTTEYPKFRPIPRFHRDVIISEKINGTNGLIEILRAETYYNEPIHADRSGYAVATDEGAYFVFAGSRNRWLSPENDNFGFAKWVWENARELTALGEGKHYGEWFGKGIQSGYGLNEKRFALFNTDRWYDPRDPEVAANVDIYIGNFPKAQPAPEIVTVVPVLAVVDGRSLNDLVEMSLHTLESEGSFIAPGFMNPEGVVLFHRAAQTYFKATIKHDEKPKSQVGGK